MCEIHWANNDMWKEEMICMKIMVKVPKVKGKIVKEGMYKGTYESKRFRKREWGRDKG